MSSGGQVVGGIVGAVVGFYVGGPSGAVYGAQIGLMAGGYIDPPKGPKGKPPSTSDLAVQTSTYGAPLSDGYGTYGTMGNIFWVEGNTLRAVEHKADQGGKGGAPSGPSTYDIFGTFAVGFGEGEIDGYGRIWFGSKLVCDFRSSDLGTIIATNENGGSIAFYTGSPTQLPNPRIQADMGAANTPAYRGLHYIVVSDWPMADYGNSLVGLQVKAEIVRTATFSQYAQRVYIPDDLIPRTISFPGALSGEKGFFNPRIESGVFKCDKSNTASGSEYAYTFAIDFEGNYLSQSVGAVETGQFGYIGKSKAGAVVFEGSTTGVFKVGGAEFKVKTADPLNTCHGMSVGGDGRIYALERVASAWLLCIYDGSDLSLISSQTSPLLHLGETNIAYPCIPGTYATFCVEPDGASVWTAQWNGTEAFFYVGTISSSGVATIVHSFSESFLGTYGIFSCIAAANGLCYGVNNGGGFYVFDRNRIINIPTVSLADIISARCLKTGLLDAGDIDVSEITQEVRGYKVPTVAAVRSSLEPLQAAWPFDVIPKGYQIKFVPRGGSSVATIDSGELGCVAGNEKSGVRISSSREMDSQLPREVRVTYLDFGREYDPNTGPGAKRWNTDAVNIEGIELAIVMSATEAAQAEEVLLYLRWLERHDVSFVLPPTRGNLEPADVVTITSPEATYELRLTSINYLPDGRIECSAKFNNAAVYTSSAVAQEGLSTGQVLTFPGASIAALMDIPCLDSNIMDRPGILAALCGYSTSWPGGTLFRSDDSGQSWNGIQGFLPPGVVMGQTTGSIGAGSTHVIDKSSRLNVRFFNGGPSSISESAMLSGGNHFAYGAHGRWEIIAAQTCTEETDGTFTLEGGMLRGRFGTERYMTTHQAFDSIVLLDPLSVRFIGLNTASINIEKQWRPVTNGRSIDTASDYPFSYSAANLKPLAPVYLNGSRNPASLDWSLNWIRRTRTPVEPFSGVNAPLAETSESYEVEIWNSGYSTLKRTISVGSASASYTSAQQINDFGSAQESLYIRIYQISSVVGRGEKFETSISRYVPLDPYIAFRVFGMHFNGTNGSTTFSEWSGKTFSASGNAQLTTTGQKFGTACGTFDGNGDVVTGPTHSDFQPGSGDYGFGGWIYPTTLTPSLQAIATTLTFGSGWVFTITSSGELELIVYTAGPTYNSIVSTTGVITVNAWNYVWWSKVGTTFRLFAGTGATATKVAETTIAGTLTSGVDFKLGTWDSDGTTGRDFNGKLDDFLGYKGTPVYTTDFAVPTIEFSDT